jgi:hypothetical protein
LSNSTMPERGQALGIAVSQMKKPPRGRLVWLIYLVAVWTLVEAPYGFWLFVFGSGLHWALYRPDQVARSHRNAAVAQARSKRA